MKTELSTYNALLLEVHAFLSRFGVKKWVNVLESWIDEVEQLSTDEEILEHVNRTRNVLGGMGSLGDIVISPINGDDIPNDKEIINATNRQYLNLIQKLDKEITRLLNIVGPK